MEPHELTELTWVIWVIFCEDVRKVMVKLFPVTIRDGIFVLDRSLESPSLLLLQKAVQHGVCPSEFLIGENVDPHRPRKIALN